MPLEDDLSVLATRHSDLGIIYWGENDEVEFAAGQINQSGSLIFAILPGALRKTRGPKEFISTQALGI